MSIVFLDTETTGLNPRSEQLFDIAVIEEDGTEHVFHPQPDDVTVRQMHPKAVEVNRYHERVASPDWWWDDEIDVAAALTDLLAGKHIVGAVPDFDTRFLDEFYDSLRLPTPRWHYHLIDVETLAVGFLYGEARAWQDVESDPRLPVVATTSAIPHTVVRELPWRSDDLARACGVESPSDEERHTALGDARWVKRWYERMTGDAK